MEKFAKGQRNQPEHHDRLMNERDIPVIDAAEPGAIGSERQTSDSDSHQQSQRKNIEAEALYSDQSHIVETAMEGKNQADQEQSSGKIQGMNNDKGERRSQRKREEREAKEPDLIERHLGGRCLSEAQPAKGQREG